MEYIQYVAKHIQFLFWLVINLLGERQEKERNKGERGRGRERKGGEGSEGGSEGEREFESNIGYASACVLYSWNFR